MKTNNIDRRIGDIPYVWVVKTEDNINVLFKFENALKAYGEEFNRLQHNSNYELSLRVAEPAERYYYAVFYRKNNWNDQKERVFIYVDDKNIMDAKIYD